MNQILSFKFLLFSITLFHFSNAQTCQCNINGNTLQCSVTGGSASIDADVCNTNGINLINIVYDGQIVLNLTSSKTIPIRIYPIDHTSRNTLQIRNIRTNATRIDVQIYLHTDQTIRSLFTFDCTIMAWMSTFSINAIQINDNLNGLQVFNNQDFSNVNLGKFEFNLNSTGILSGNLNFHSLVYGLKNLTSMTIVGNNHTLIVDRSKMPSTIGVQRLSLKKLRLQDQILYNITHLQTYSIEECIYGMNSNFLNSTPTINVSVVMKNNYPTGSDLPYNLGTFNGGINLINLTLIEPRLTSASLKSIRTLAYPANALIELGTYNQVEMSNWAANKPNIWYLTIRNIKTLDVFPRGFFNAFHAIHQTTLQGSFKLDKSAICIFTGINRQLSSINPMVILDSVQKGSNDWNNCADTYIKAISYNSMNDIRCPEPNTCEDCEKWASDTEKCNLITYEGTCSARLESTGNNFYYNNSYLYYFFQNRSWLTSTSQRPPISRQDSINIGAIIGALCGLLVAGVILVLTILCIRRHRRKHTSDNISAPRIENYKASAHDNTHISIATSKSSQSSRYALEHSFFPEIKPKDEIAPPLYTAPSESVATTSVYNAPSAPPARRDSVSTRATHIYETVDP